MSALDTVMSLAKSIGTQALSSMYPNDFEWYMVAIELADSQEKTVDYLTFPIMPDSMSKTEYARTNLKKSLSGLTVLSNPSFTPQELTIKGNFGRQFKILANPNGNLGDSNSIKNGKWKLADIIKKEKGSLPGVAFANFDMNIKTGYGVLKMLQAIVSKSVGLDDYGKPYRLYFYNMALGESYLVFIPPSGIQFSQDVTKNMIWNYSLTMTILAPLEFVSNRHGEWSSLLESAIQTGVNEVASAVSDALQPVTETVLEGWL